MYGRHAGVRDDHHPASGPEVLQQAGDPVRLVAVEERHHPGARGDLEPAAQVADRELFRRVGWDWCDATRHAASATPVARKGKRKNIKNNLSYFDALNFSDRITCPVLSICGLKDTLSPPECVFGLFNRLKTEKTIEIYPDDGNEAGGENQFQKSVKWLSDTISGT